MTDRLTTEQPRIKRPHIYGARGFINYTMRNAAKALAMAQEIEVAARCPPYTEVGPAIQGLVQIINKAALELEKACRHTQREIESGRLD